MRQRSTQEFIEQAKKIHGDQYIYDQVEYINSRTPVKIICKEHGVFEQKPQYHIVKGSGCPLCSKVQGGKKRRSSGDSFIKKAIEVHKNKYDYSQVKYVSATTHVDIICPTHGLFVQTPRQHLLGHGCKKCKDELNAELRRDTKTSFIKKVRSQHKNKYDYSKVSNVSRQRKNKITIGCPIHGEFTQNVGDHLNGHGCPKCGRGLYNAYFFNSNPDQSTLMGYIYLMKIEDETESFLKVGITKNNPTIRQTHFSGYKSTILQQHIITLKQAYEVEQQLLFEFNDFRITPSKKFGGHTECLDISIQKLLEKRFGLLEELRY